MTNELDRFVWIREGDHRAEMESAIAECAREHGGVAVGAPSVGFRPIVGGGSVTGLEASGQWWLEHMAIHGKGWSKPIPFDKALDIINPQPPLGP